MPLAARRRPASVGVPLSFTSRAEHLMGMPEMLERWTAARVRDLPDDGKRYEVVDGELLVTPAPRFDHQRAVGVLYLALHPYIAQAHLGEVVISPADIEFDPATLVQPDVFVVPLVGGRRPKTWADIRGLLLAVEVLSPSTARADRTIKRRRYQRAGVPEYWIVDLDARLIERWPVGDERPEVLTERLAWQPDPSGPPFELDLPRFFAEALAEE